MIDPNQPTDEFLRERFGSLLEMSKGTKITETHYTMFKAHKLETMDEIEQAYKDLIHFLTHHEYYDTIERIDKGETLLAEETDPSKQKRYRERLHELKIKLERLTPKEDSA